MVIRLSYSLFLSNPFNQKLFIGVLVKKVVLYVSVGFSYFCAASSQCSSLHTGTGAV